MFRSFRYDRAEVFAGLSIVVLLLVSSGHAVSASPGNGPAGATTSFQQQTGTITVLKRFCEADNSPNQNSNCNGRVNEAEGTNVTFEVRVGANVTVGAVVQTIVVSIVQQGNASQGSATGGALTAGLAYTVCEIPVPGYTPIPRPGNQGGSNQTLVNGAPCISVVLGPGNNDLQYNNFVLAVPTATNTPAPTATNTPAPTATNTPAPTATSTSESTATETTGPTPTIANPCCASPIVETPDIPSDDDGDDDSGSGDGSTGVVGSLPSTGNGNNSRNGTAVLMVLGMAWLIMTVTAIAIAARTPPRPNRR